MSPGAAPAQRDCPGLPRGDDDEPVFHAPWQAQAFALTLQLHERGLFTWPQWAQALAARVADAAAAADPDPLDPRDPREAADRYYGQWLAALEHLLRERQAVGEAELQRHARAWEHAAARTPHGQPIELRDEDFVAPLAGR